MRNNKNKPLKWRATDFPQPQTLHNIGLKQWGFKAWREAFIKLCEELGVTAEELTKDLEDLKNG